MNFLMNSNRDAFAWEYSLELRNFCRWLNLKWKTFHKLMANGTIDWSTLVEYIEPLFVFRLSTQTFIDLHVITIAYTNNTHLKHLLCVACFKCQRCFFFALNNPSTKPIKIEMEFHSPYHSDTCAFHICVLFSYDTLEYSFQHLQCRCTVFELFRLSIGERLSW